MPALIPPVNEPDDEFSAYAIGRSTRRILWAVLVVAASGAVALAAADPILSIRLTIPALVCVSVANLCATSLIFARRLLPVDVAYRLGYNAGRQDERRAYVGDL